MPRIRRSARRPGGPSPTRPVACSWSAAFRRQTSLVGLQRAVDPLWIQVGVQIVVHHQGRSPVATAETYDRKQRESFVRGGFTKPDAEALAEMLAHPVVAHHPAAHAVAEHDHMASHGLAKNEVIKGGDTIQVRGRHAEMRGDIIQAFVGHPAPVPLHDFQRINAHRFTCGIVRGLNLDLLDLIRAQHRAASYRSMSASTKSMTPKMAIRSGTINPREINGS